MADSTPMVTAWATWQSGLFTMTMEALIEAQSTSCLWHPPESCSRSKKSLIQWVHLQASFFYLSSYMIIRLRALRIRLVVCGLDFIMRPGVHKCHCQGCSKWVSRGIRDRYFFVGIIHARRDIEARVGILTGRIC
jgi:hypothetical protein